MQQNTGVLRAQWSTVPAAPPIIKERIPPPIRSLLSCYRSRTL